MLTPIQALSIKALREEYFRKYRKQLALSDKDIMEALAFCEPTPWAPAPDVVEMLHELEECE